MPMYEYACEKCNKRLEAIQKFSDPLLTECPDCKGKLKKLMSNTSFILKGTGWYVTDYARKENTGGAGSAQSQKKSASKDKTDGKKAAPAESKTESKAAPAPNTTP